MMPSTSWQSISPKRVLQDILPNSCSTPTLHFAIDAAKTENTFDFKFTGLEKQFMQIAEQHIELASRETNGVRGQ
jgi:hypothetical protein